MAQHFGNPAQAVDDLSRDEFGAALDLSRAQADPSLVSHVARLRDRLAHLTGERVDAEDQLREHNAESERRQRALDRQARSDRRLILQTQIQRLTADRALSQQTRDATITSARLRHNDLAITLDRDLQAARTELAAIPSDTDTDTGD